MGAYSGHGHDHRELSTQVSDSLNRQLAICEQRRVPYSLSAKYIRKELYECQGTSIDFFQNPVLLTAEGG